MSNDLSLIIRAIAAKLLENNKEYSPDYWIKLLTDLLEQQAASDRNVLTVKVDTSELKQVLDDFDSKRFSYDRTEYVMLPRQLDINLLEAGSIASDYDLSQERVAKVFKSIVNHYEITKQLKENKQ